MSKGRARKRARKRAAPPPGLPRPTGADPPNPPVRLIDMPELSLFRCPNSACGNRTPHDREIDCIVTPSLQPDLGHYEAAPLMGDPPVAESGYDEFKRLFDGIEAVEVHAAVARPVPGLIEPLVLPERQGMWLDRFVAKDDTRAIRRALKQQGWTIVATGTRTSGAHDRAYPPGVEPGGWPYVLLPGTIGEGRAVANLVAALRRAGPFKWKGR